MENFKFVLLILLNYPFEQTEAGKIWITDEFEILNYPKRVEPRLKRAIDHNLAVDLLLKDKVSELSKRAGDSYLSVTMEHMDAPSLLKHLDKLKEEYAAKEKKGDAEEVRSSLDKLSATLVTLSKATRPPKSGPAEILAQLSEEELNDEGVMYNEFYSDDEYIEEKESSNPSLLGLQSWNRKSSGTSVWDW